MVGKKTIYYVTMIVTIIGSLNAQTTNACTCSIVDPCIDVRAAVAALQAAAVAFNTAAQAVNDAIAQVEAAKSDPNVAQDPEAIAALEQAANDLRTVAETYRAAARTARTEARRVADQCDADTCCHSCCDSIYSNLDDIFNPNATASYDITTTRTSTIGTSTNVPSVQAIPIGCQSKSFN